MRILIKSINRIAGKESRKLILLIVLSCIESLLQASMFFIMILSMFDLLRNDFTKEKLLFYTISMLSIFIVRCFVTSINYVQVQYRGADITAALRLSLGNHIRGLNLGYFNKNSIGKLSATLSTDISDFEGVITHSLSGFFKAIFFSIIAIISSFSLEWRYTLVVLAIIFITIPLVGAAGKMSAKRGGVLKQSINEVISRVIEYINGIKTFRLYNLTGTKFKRLDKSFQTLRKESIKLELSVMPFVMGFFILISWIIPIALVLGTHFLQNGMEQETFIALIMLSISLSSMLMSIGAIYPEMRYFNKATENIIRVFDEEPLTYEKDVLNNANGEIVFRKVAFRYEKDVDVLKNISFEAKSGSVTALVGPSGSGKTTIISLISRFWDVTKGGITIGGEDIKSISPDGLTKEMAVVFQEVYLLNDTVANNIRIGKPDATIEEIIEVAKTAQCHDFISEMENGYDTVIGEGGSTLSGGEKQRISIARAMIKNARILLLDESTSNLDVDNEKEIHHAIDTLMKERTVIVIAHRLNTIRNADNILVLDKGEILEQGTHISLLEQDGWYARMIEEQDKAKKWEY
jgi:ABC-type multidrug transport system, ATPase and permease components